MKSVSPRHFLRKPINIDNFYGKEDLGIKITREQFEELCNDLYVRIKNINLLFNLK